MKMKKGMKLSDFATMLNTVMYFMLSMPWKNHMGNMTLPKMIPKYSRYREESVLNLSIYVTKANKNRKLIPHRMKRPIMALFRYVLIFFGSFLCSDIYFVADRLNPKSVNITKYCINE